MNQDATKSIDRIVIALYKDMREQKTDIKASGSDVEDSPMTWLFGLSSSWLRAEEKRKTEKETKKGR